MSKTRNQKKRDWTRLLLILSVIAWAVILLSVVISRAAASSAADSANGAAEESGRLPGDDVPAETRCYMTEEEIQEDYENFYIEQALLSKAHKIDGCTVTWYTSETCGKKPGDSAYGVTYSGLPVTEHLTCAVDPSVIPLYSDVFVQYADGTIEQLWATDTGVKGNAVDIYTPDYDYAIQMGRQRLTVWWLENGG